MRASLAGLVLAIAVTNPGQISYTANSGTKRSVASKLGDTVSICDFEATCPSATDDTAAVNAAIAALPSNGGKLVIPAGTFHFNASAITKSIDIECAGSGNINTGNGGTRINPFTLSSPIFQFGNGAATTARGMRLANCILVGDGVNATGDGIYLFGARDVTIDNVALTSFGRNGIRIQCNTTSSSGIHIRNAALATNSGPALSIETCAGSFTSDITVTDSHINAGSVAGSHALYLDSTDVRLVGTYIDTHDAVTGGGVKLAKTGSSSPIIRCAASTIDNADGAAAVTIDVSTWLTAANRMATVVSGSCTTNGEIKYSDATVAISATREAAFLQPWIAGPSFFNSTHWPLDEATANTDTVTISRAGATPDTDAQLIVAHAALKIAGTSTTPLQLGTSALYKNTNSLLMWRKDTTFPSAENNAQQLGWVEVTPSTASTTVTIDASLGNVFDATFTTNANHTIANPSGSGVGVSSHSQSLMDICVINTSGGALGVFTWSGNYRFSGGTQPPLPATGFRQCIQFRQDASGSPWRETWRSFGDVTN